MQGSPPARRKSPPTAVLAGAGQLFRRPSVFICRRRACARLVLLVLLRRASNRPRPLAVQRTLPRFSGLLPGGAAAAAASRPFDGRNDRSSRRPPRRGFSAARQRALQSRPGRLVILLGRKSRGPAGRGAAIPPQTSRHASKQARLSSSSRPSGPSAGAAADSAQCAEQPDRIGSRRLWNAAVGWRPRPRAALRCPASLPQTMFKKRRRAGQKMGIPWVCRC